jgi:DinB family protein
MEQVVRLRSSLNRQWHSGFVIWQGNFVILEMTDTREKATLLTRLRESEATFVNAASVPEELAAVCPDASCWSILQITEHLGITERGMFGRFQAAELNTAPPNFDFDEKITQIGGDRSSKRNAPERVHPTGKFTSEKDALAEFRKARREAIDFIASYSDDLRKKKVIHPIGEMDGHQLFLLIAAHSERHARQVEEVKSSAAYRAASQQKKAV